MVSCAAQNIAMFVLLLAAERYLLDIRTVGFRCPLSGGHLFAMTHRDFLPQWPIPGALVNSIDADKSL